MKVLMLDNGDPLQLAACYQRGLANDRFTVIPICLSSIGNTFGRGVKNVLRNFVPKIAFRSENLRLRKSAYSIRPDVVWIFKGMEVYPSSLRLLRRQGITLVNYNPDHPYEFSSHGCGNENVSKAVPLYDLYITYSRHIAAQIRLRHPTLQVAIIPFGHEVSDETFAMIASEEERLRLCFVGNPDRRRRDAVLRLLGAGLPVDVFGQRWDRFLAPAPGLRMQGQVTGLDMYRTLRRYRVQMNFFRPHNINSHNMRSFEAPACGAVMLAEDSIEHRNFFEPEKEAFYFPNDDAMVAQARRLLAMPKSEINSIRAAARRRSVSSGYHYRDRASAVLSVITAVHKACVGGNKPITRLGCDRA